MSGKNDVPMLITLSLTKEEIRDLLVVARREQLDSVVNSLEEVISHSSGLEDLLKS